MSGRAGRLRGRPALVGRDGEVATLAAVVDDVARGRSRIAVLEGEAGIGKSRLVDAAIEAASAADFEIRCGGGGALEQDRPFGPVADALKLVAGTGDVGGEAADLLDGDDGAAGINASSPPAELRYRIADAMVAHAERLVAIRPVLIVVEDLHWADPSTLMVLHQFARRLAHHRLALLLTARPVPRSTALTTFLASLPPERSERVHLAGLSDDATSRLAGDVLGAAPGEELLTWLQGAAGNPLFVIELLDALVRDDAVEVRDDRAQVSVTWSPESLHQIILRRVEETPPAALRALRAAAILGASFRLDDLATMLDQPSSVLLDALDEPLRAGLIIEAGDHLAFGHALVHDAVYHGTPSSGRQALHLQAARRLARAGRSTAEIARHFRIGARPGDIEAQQWLRRAAQHASVRAPAVAVDLYETVVALTSANDPGGDVLHDTVVVELASALGRCGRLADAIERLTELLARTHSESVEAPAQLALVRDLAYEGRLTEATAAVERALEGTGLSPGARSRLLAEASLAHLLSGAISEAVVVAERAEPEARIHDDVALATVLAVQAWALGLRGHTKRAIATARQAVRRAASAPTDASGGNPELLLGILLMDGDHLAEAQERLGTARRSAEELGTVRDLPLAHWASGLGHFLAGDYDDAVAEIETGRELTRDVGSRISLVWADAILAHVHIQRDELEAARWAVTEGESELAERGPQIKGDWLLWARALLHDIEGRPDLAHEVLRAAWDGASALGVVAERPMLGPDLVRLCLSLGREREACAVAAEVEHAAGAIGAISARASASRCTGLARRDAASLVRSVDAFRKGSRTMELAFACEDAGQALAVQGNRAEAIDLLEEARRRYQGALAVRGVRRTSAVLRGLGVRSGHRGGQRRASTGWEALTDSERRVTRLAAEGLTNPEIGERLFVSRRTVETHLSHVFTKLGLPSRVALAAAVMKLDVEAQESLAAPG